MSSGGGGAEEAMAAGDRVNISSAFGEFAANVQEEEYSGLFTEDNSVSDEGGK